MGAVADSVTSLINLGKYGSFHANQIIGRPYHLTFEILDRSETREGRELRVVSAAELHAATIAEQAETEYASTPRTEGEDTGTQGTPKSNVNIHDDPRNQRLTMADIETLKQGDMDSGRELIEKIMQSHSSLDQKTEFSLAKYTLRKHKKYMKRFCVLPLDVGTLIDWMMTDRDFSRIMELRNEVVGLIGCWANIHADGQHSTRIPEAASSLRYLVVDDTGGLMVATLAERMGILHQTKLEGSPAHTMEGDLDGEAEQNEVVPPHKQNRQRYDLAAMSATSNSITMVHTNQQPSLGLLRYFNFDSNNPNPSHPLYTNLKNVSWLQLLEPESDVLYLEPEAILAEELAKVKTNRRSEYYRKRRRWERTRSVVDETRAGGFNGLVVASFLDPVSTLRHLVPLLAGGSQVVVYSPHIEPLVELADRYSTARRTAFISTPPEQRQVPSVDFPVDPTLLLGPMVQTARVRKWQVLPGRTHPLMTGKGGAEGYIFAATRVLPAEGRVQARGNAVRGKKAKIETTEQTVEVDSGVSQSPLKKQKIQAEDDVLSAETAAVELKPEHDGEIQTES